MTLAFLRSIHSLFVLIQGISNTQALFVTNLGTLPPSLARICAEISYANCPSECLLAIFSVII